MYKSSYGVIYSNEEMKMVRDNIFESIKFMTIEEIKEKYGEDYKDFIKE